mgnify:CR=1 FL=1
MAISEEIKVLIKSILDSTGFKNAKKEIKSVNKKFNKFNKIFSGAKGMARQRESLDRFQESLKRTGYNLAEVPQELENQNGEAKRAGSVWGNLRKRMDDIPDMTLRQAAAHGKAASTLKEYGYSVKESSKQLLDMKGNKADLQKVTRDLSSNFYKERKAKKALDSRLKDPSTKKLTDRTEKLRGQFKQLTGNLNRKVVPYTKTTTGIYENLDEQLQKSSKDMNRLMAPVGKLQGRHEQLTKATDKQVEGLLDQGVATEKLESSMDRSAASVKRFNFENLSLMFGMMQLSKTTQGFLQPAAKAQGLTEEWGNTLETTMTPAMEAIRPAFMTINKMLRNMSPLMKKAVGFFMIGVFVISKFGMAAFQAQLAMQGLNLSALKSGSSMGFFGKMVNFATGGLYGKIAATEKDTATTELNTVSQYGLIGALQIKLGILKANIATRLKGIAVKMKDIAANFMKIKSEQGLAAAISATASALWGTITAQIKDLALKIKGAVVNILYGNSASAASVGVWSLAAAVIALIGPISLVIAGTAILTGHMDWLRGAIDQVVVAFQTVIDYLTNFKTALWVLLPGIMLVVKAVKILSKALAGSGLQEAFSIAAGDAQGLLSSLGSLIFSTQLMGGYTDWLGKKWQQAAGFIANAAGSISSAAGSIWSGLLAGGGKIIETLKESFGKILKLPIIKQVASFIGGLFDNPIKTIKIIFGKFVKFFAGIWNTIKSLPIIGTVASFIENLFKSPISTIRNLFNKLKNFFASIFNAIKTLPVIGQLAKLIETFLDSPVSSLRTLWNSFKKFFKGIFKTMKNLPIIGTFVEFIETLLDDPVSTLESLWKGFKNIWDSTWSTIKSVADSAFSWVENNVLDPFISVLETLKEKFDWMMEHGGNAIASGVSSATGAVTSALGRKDDFVWRPGEGVTSFNPRDTLIGVKDTGSVGGRKVINFNPNITVNATVRDEVDVDDLKDRLSREWIDELEGYIR